MSNIMRLREAGIREQEYAQKRIKGYHKQIDFLFLIDHAVYDTSTDTISFSLNGVPHIWKVDRP